MALMFVMIPFSCVSVVEPDAANLISSPVMLWAEPGAPLPAKVTSMYGCERSQARSTVWPLNGVVSWALGFQEGFGKRARPRIGVHYGETIYRDGDYYGRNVNLAARIVTRAEGGEVLVSEPVYELMPPDPKLSFEPIGEVELKGFSQPVRLYVARPLADGGGGSRRRR